MSAYIDTYYKRTLKNDDPYPALDSDQAADVCIVGGGLAGLTAALDLARSGRQVIVLEAQRVAWGASGRNGGFVSPGYSASLDHIRRAVGPDDSAALMRLSIEGVGIVAENIASLGIAEAKPVYGSLKTSRYENTAGLKARQEMMERDFGYRLEFRTREEVREVLRSPKYHQALYDSAAFHFHPLNYARALAREIVRLGGRIFEDSGVTAMELDGPTKIIRTAGGSVAAKDVVIACGGYTGRLLPKLARSHIPIATYVLLTEPAKDRIAEAIRTNAAIGDGRRAGDYYRLVDDGERILWGGKITTRTAEPRRLAELLTRTMVSTYPQLKGIGVETAWSGLMSYARHLMPQIGKLQPGVWYCMGFGGHGMNTTAIGGRVVAEAIAGKDDRYRRFAPFGLVWNGGPAGVAAVQLTYWTYQMMDFLKERQAA
ncbi:FAD-binding oxidoreductase [Inquilinus sp. CAU 1745]|uniref:NAD(P)/FAD-dependent oxidoreductase n=1 Tax=Inquilinus sp. CAU 1745 TaxID=3140369 RepID=UPI00325B972A